MVIPVQVSLPYKLTALATTEFDDLRNVNNTGRHAGFASLVNISHSIVTKNDGLGGGRIAGADDAYSVAIHAGPTLAYLLASNLQLDTATYIGLNKAAPDFVAYVGISQRF